MSRYLLQILYGFGIILLCAWAAPWETVRGINTSENKDYVDGVLRQAKAAEMKSYMNESVDPCDDFYEFACGNWPRVNKATGSILTTGLFERLTTALNKKIKVVLNEPHEEYEYYVNRHAAQVKDFYNSCKNVTEIDNNYRNELKKLISIFGKMPVLEGQNWKESEFNWMDVVSQISKKYGMSIIIGSEITKDIANNKVNIVYIGPQEMPLETRSMYLNDRTEIYRKRYRDLMAKKLQDFLDVDKSLSYETATELLEFEVHLAHGLLDENADISLMDISELTTVKDMQLKYAPTINISHLLNISIGAPIDKVYDLMPQYKENLLAVIPKTSNRTLANYIFYRLIDEFTMTPGKTEEAREKDCVAITKKYFSENLDNMIYRKFNNNDTASDIDLIWSELRDTFKLKLQSNESLNWISNGTRQLAIKKLNAMQLEINTHAKENLGVEFKFVTFYNNYLENLQKILEVSAAYARNQLNLPVKPLQAGELLSFTPANILLENVIKVPVALLQPNFLWSGSYPNAIKFGTLASLIGHELIHGFDNDGRKFDARGNAADWWDKSSGDNFTNRQRCFTDQYSKYIYNGQQLPVTNSQSENIADNGGVRLAYDAYSKWQESQKSISNDYVEKEKLPSLKYSNKQLFFLSYAQIWCNDVHPRLRNLLVATDQHVPGKFRVIGTLSNFDEFGKEFNCKPGSPMVPDNKCRLY